MTVADVLAAHAKARIASARQADEAYRETDGPEIIVIDQGSPSFAVSWAFEATVIGMTRPKGD